MRVATKLWSGYGLLLVLLGSLLVYHVRIIEDLAAAQRRLTAVSVQVSVSSAEQLYRLDRLWDAGQKFHVLRDSAYAHLYERVAGEIDSTLFVLDTLSRGAPEGARVDELGATWRRFRTGSEAEIPPAEVLTAERDTLRRAVADVSEAARSSMLAEISSARHDVQQARRSAFVVGASALLAGLTIILMIIRSITRSLSRLSAATREVARGRFGHRLEGPHDKEFRELADNFNQMVHRLEEVDELKRNFLSGISHDLKSPLASIKEAMRVLLDGIPGPLNPKQQRLLELGLASGDRLTAMISDLLMLARLESHAIRYSFEDADLADLARRAVERLEMRLERNGVTARVDAPEHLKIDCDSDRIAQVIENLLDNGLKFSPRDAVIDVAVQPLGAGEVEVRVADRGIGVKDEDKEAIFERFAQRGEPGGSAGGVGLGLTICREIVTAHRGYIGVEDTPGGGSTFVVRLPVVQPEEVIEKEPGLSAWATSPT